MTILRRTLIAVVSLLLALDVAALGVLKLSGEPQDSGKKSKVVFWIDDKADAENIVALLKEEGQEPLIKAAKRPTFVDFGFRVAMEDDVSENGVLLKSTEEHVKRSGFGPLSYSEDGTILYYGGIYQKKNEAKNIVKALAEKGVTFEVRAGEKKVMKASQRVILLEISEASVDTIIAKVEDSVEVAQTDEEPLGEPKESMEMKTKADMDSKEEIESEEEMEAK